MQFAWRERSLDVVVMNINEFERRPFSSLEKEECTFKRHDG